MKKPATEIGVWGKAVKRGNPPAMMLVNPKYPRNIGMALRLASCYGLNQVFFTGKRINLDSKEQRLPREERMRGYKSVDLINCDYVFDLFDKGSVTPVAVEVRENAVPLTMFEHPKNPLYVFGPEDGSIDQVTLRHCHNLIVIPTRHCLNLATAISTILWDREYKLWASGESANYTPGEYESRGILTDFDMDEHGEPCD